MSDLVTDPDDADEASGALAAEFVLGTLESVERIHASELVDRDPQFRGMVRVWERRLGELHLMVEPVEPPAAIWDRIKPQLDSIAPAEMVSPPDAAEAAEPAAEATPDTTSVTANTIATLEALEAELREEGLAPAVSTAPSEPPTDASTEVLTEVTTEAAAPVAESPPLVVGEPEAEPLPALVPAPVARQEAAASALAQAGWGLQLFAAVMTLVAVVLVGLIAAWRFIPERLPARLRAVQVLNIPIPQPPPPPARPTAPPGSQFDE